MNQFQRTFYILLIIALLIHLADETLFDGGVSYDASIIGTISATDLTQEESDLFYDRYFDQKIAEVVLSADGRTDTIKALVFYEDVEYRSFPLPAKVTIYDDDRPAHVITID